MGTQQIIGNLQIVTGSVGRNELNTITPDQAVVTKIIAGSGVTLSSSGVDAGTGDVTISVSGTGGASSSFDNFWTSGSAGQYSIRAKNNTNINALGAYSFAVGGNNTLASGSHSVAEGDGVRALGSASHAEGSGSLAMKIGDHAEGISTVANGPSSHAEGNGVVVHGQASHGEGERNIVSGTNSFVGGFNNSNFSAFSAIVGGTGTVLPVSAVGSVALGRGLAGYSMPYPDTVFTPNLNVRFVQSGTPITNLGIDANGNIVSGTSSAASSLLIQDEGIPKGSALTLNVVGSNIDVSVSGTVAQLSASGTFVDTSTFITGSYALLNGKYAPTGSYITGSYTLLDGRYSPTGTSSGLSTDGWILKSDTWIRTGDYTFILAGDATSAYRKGTKIRYKDGGTYEYGVIISSSYASGTTTTVNLFINSDYAMASTTITDKYLSYIEMPEGFPTEFNFVPSFSNLTPGTGSSTTAKAKIIGCSLQAHIEVVLGTSPTVGNVGIANPVAMSGYGHTFDRIVIGLVNAYDDSANISYPSLCVTTDANNSVMRRQTANTTDVQQSTWSSTSPFTWAINDMISIIMDYFI